MAVYRDQKTGKWFIDYYYRGKCIRECALLTTDINNDTKGGIFSHATQARAEAQSFPGSSAALDLPRVTLLGEYWGRTNVNGKIAAVFFRPVEVLA